MHKGTQISILINITSKIVIKEIFSCLRVLGEYCTLSIKTRKSLKYDFIFHCSNYQIKRNEKLINCFNNFDDYLSEESLWQISEKIKPRGGNKKRLEFDS